MSLEKLSRLDLNLLVCLHVLLEQNSVSKAADQLNLSQSAISKSLARLRDLFDDPLLERSGYGMEPTERAKQLQPDLANLLFDIEKLTAPKRFEPYLSDRCFRIAMVESIYSMILPRFIDDAFSLAPNIKMETCNWDSSTFDHLQKGELDFALTGKDLHPKDAQRTLTPPQGITSQELFRDGLSCVMKADHPALERAWDLNAYISNKHIVTKNYKNERWLLDMKLHEVGLERNVAVHAPDFNNAAELCCHTNLVLTLPNLFARHISPKHGLKVLPLPFDMPPLCYTLFWNTNRDKDLAHLWLRNLILSRCEKMAL